MSKFVKVAAVQGTRGMPAGAAHGSPEAHAGVLNGTRQALESCRGHGVDLIATSEGVEGCGQVLDTAETLSEPGPYLQMYSEFASSEGCHVAGSCKIREGDHVYNSIAFIGPDGAILGAYHKTFITAGEREQVLTSGQGAVVLETQVGRLGGAICFDLNFLPLRSEYTELKPDIIVFSSAYHGGLAQVTWAYECRSYFLSALGTPDGGILDPFGRPVKLASEYTPIPMARINLDYVLAHLDYNRGKFPEILRKYGEDVTIDIPAHVGSALITSHSPDRTAMDVAREYELELLDDYFARSIAENLANRATPA